MDQSFSSFSSSSTFSKSTFSASISSSPSLLKSSSSREVTFNNGKF
jgi:hypothetical protein